MGAFNTLTLEQECPLCGEEVEIHLQFKYGDIWQRLYRLGEELEWGGNDMYDRQHR